MDALSEFYEAVRDQFPALTTRADAEFAKRWDKLDPEFVAYSWFESLADALNADMRRGVNAEAHRRLFSFINAALTSSSDEVVNCIDVSFVESLFWRVSAEQAYPYWVWLPQGLKDLYIAFHHRNPV